MSAIVIYDCEIYDVRTRHVSLSSRPSSTATGAVKSRHWGHKPSGVWVYHRHPEQSAVIQGHIKLCRTQTDTYICLPQRQGTMQEHDLHELSIINCNQQQSFNTLTQFYLWVSVTWFLRQSLLTLFIVKWTEIKQNNCPNTISCCG